MRPRRRFVTRVAAAVLLVVSAPAFRSYGQASPSVGDRPRLLVLTDISNEPDDEESLVRLLVYANEFDIEGLVATTSTWLRQGTREDLVRRGIAAYGQVRDNLAQHASGYPAAEALLAALRSNGPQISQLLRFAG